MRKISNTDRYYSYGETSWEDGSIAEFAKGSDKALIHKADSVPITLLFSFYKVQLDTYKKMICPLPFHKGGRERTPSFKYYPETNTFYCFGCHSGSTSTDFVAAMDKTNKTNAASKILELFESDSSDDIVECNDDFLEKINLNIDFANVIREFRQNHLEENSTKFIENMCLVYDNIMLKHKDLSNEAISNIIQQLKERISKFK